VIKLKKTINLLQEDNANLKLVNDSYKQEVEALKHSLELAEHNLNVLQRGLFGKKSEKLKDDNSLQLKLAFDEAENSEPEEDLFDEDDFIEVPPHVRKKKTTHKDNFKNLPHQRVEHDLTEEAKICHCGCEMHKIGEEVSTQLDFIPAQLKVLEHARFKYACRECSENVQVAPPPIKPINKGLPTSGLLAHILVAKFADAMPLFRQVKSWKRFGVNLNDATLCNWVLACGTSLTPIAQAMKINIVASDYVCSDETTLQVIEVDKSKCYMWVHMSGESENRAIVFDYHDNRAGKCVLDFLDGFTGTHQCDGYSGYDILYRNNANIIRAGCMDHARRKFFDIDKQVNKAGIARKILNKMKLLYKVEKLAKKKKLDYNQIKELRQNKSKPLLDDIHQILLYYKDKTPSGGALGNAISYTLNQWLPLTAYLENGKIRISNIDCERAIKPFVIGRKNWMFNATQKGAKASACIYSIIETCKANNINPYEYLRYVLLEIKKIGDDPEKLEKLLPYNIDKSLIEIT
jgi:transposase